MKYTTRSRNDILIAILSCLDEPSSKTAIMYRAHISYTQLTKYYKFILDKRLIRVQNGRSVITDKGKAFLKASMEANQILDNDSDI